MSVKKFKSSCGSMSFANAGEHGRWERYDIQGEVKPECLPQWAKERLENIRQKETEVADTAYIAERELI